jgi:YaiO family outer membrane protein
VDCLGSIDLAAGIRIRGGVTAGGSIRLAAGAQAASFWAREILVQPADVLREEEADSAQVPELTIPPDPDAEIPAPDHSGFDPVRLKQLSSDTWVHNGDLILRVPVTTKVKLLIRGSFACAPRSVLHDVKASGALRIGECCRCEGNLFSQSDITVGSKTYFGGLIHAGRTVHLRAGVRGGTPADPVVVYGSKALIAEEGVVVCGKLASGGSVVSVKKHEQISRKPQITARSSRRVLLDRIKTAGAMLLLVATFSSGSLFCQDSDGSQPAGGVLPVHVEAGGYGTQVNHGFGSWRSADAQIWIRSNPHFIPVLTVESQTRPLGTQQNYSFFSYLNWSKSFYTVQSVSVAPQHNETAIYFPKTRYDLKAFWKVPPGRQFVLAGGITRFNFGASGKGEIYNVGSVYYHDKLIVEGNLFVNRNQPGNLYSASGTISTQYGREGVYWAGVTAGGGRELYNYIGVAPFDVKFFSYSIRPFYRRWLSRHMGYTVSLLYLHKIQAYRQMGASAKLFVEF